MCIRDRNRYICNYALPNTAVEMNPGKYFRFGFGALCLQAYFASGYSVTALLQDLHHIKRRATACTGKQFPSVAVPGFDHRLQAHHPLRMRGCFLFRPETTCRRQSISPLHSITPVSYTHLDVYKRQPSERSKPELLKASRKRRIAMGAGVQVQEINRLLKQFEQMQKMMKQFSKGGMGKLMRGMKGMLPGMR